MRAEVLEPNVRVALTDEQEMLAELARELAVQSSFPTSRLQEPPPVEPGRWQEIVGADLVGLHVPEALGGADASTLDVALVVEELGRARSVLPYLGAVLAVELLWRVEPASKELRAILDGERGGSVVVDDSWRELAHSGFAFDATDGAFAVGCADDLVTVQVVDRVYGGADLTRRLARVGDPTPTRLGPIKADGVTRFRAFALSLLAADLVGVMGGTLDAAVEHARHREQYGQPIGSYQAVQHLCAEQLVVIEAARSAMWYSAWAADELDPDEALLAARVAKAYAAGAARAVCEAAIQVWGGLGFTWEYPAHIYLRRALATTAFLGDEHTQLDAIAATRSGG